MMQFRRLITYIILIAIFSGGGGCSSKPDSNTKSLWIWDYVEQPDQENNASDTLLALLELNEKAAITGQADMDAQIIESLCRFGRSKHNELRLIPEYIFPDPSPWYALEIGDKRIDITPMSSLIESIRAVVNRQKKEGNSASWDQLGQCLLLVGFQISCNGEDRMFAAFRVFFWESAVELLMKAHPEHEAKLQLQLDKLLQEAREFKHWKINEIRQLQ